MKVYRASTEGGWSIIIAHTDIQSAYEMAAGADRGYVDAEYGVFEMDLVYTNATDPQILDEF